MQSTERARMAGRLVARAATAAAILTLGSAITQLCPPAQAAHGRRHAQRHVLSRSAHLLAGIVRHSAHMAGRGSPAGVVTIRCCGHRTLAVYYRSRPRSGLPWHGTYELTVRRRGSFLVSVGVTFTCGIEQLVNFLAAIANEPQILATNEINITGGGDKKKNIVVRLSLSGVVPKRLVPAKRGLGAF